MIVRMERRNNQELIAYAAETQKQYLELAQKRKIPQPVANRTDHPFTVHLRHIFNSFYALEYGQCTAAPEEAEKVFQSVKNIYQLLCELYPHGLFLMEKLLFRHPFSQD